MGNSGTGLGVAKQSWKSGLRQAADELRLDSKAKAKATVAVSIPVVNGHVMGIADERPSAPPMPGYPTNPSGQYAAHAAPGKPRDLPVGNPFPPNAHTSSGAAVAKKPVTPQTKKPAAHLGARSRPLALPISNPQPTRIKGLLQQPRSPDRLVKPSQGLHTKAKFGIPDMADYPICHVAAGACVDQSWQEAGTELTLRQPENRGRRQCTVGLDFGTAFTKACVQFGPSTFVVHWDRAIPNCTPFLLPGVFTELPSGKCVLGTDSAGRVQGDLKMALLSGASAESKINATAFLALVTRYIRSWLFSQHGNAFGGFQLEWSINVGLPAVPWDNLDLRNLYESIAFAGWQLGAAVGPITIQAAALVLSRVQTDAAAQPGGSQRERVAAFPEFVAQINSYRKSPQRRRDLHLLVDVGAGTVDIVTFHVWEPEETDCYSILEASVERLGTHVLLGYRAQAGELKHNRWDEAAVGLPIRVFESKFGLSQGKLQPLQEYFVDQVHISLERLLRKTKARRYETSPAWKEGVPFFLCGGGRNVDVYREAIRRVKADRLLFEMQLPWPDSLVPGKLARQDFHRVSVAHGLSYSADNIGQIERRSEVPDLHRSPLADVDYSSRYIEK
jgi:hypothetical protein